MANQSFTVNVNGMKLSIGKRVVHLNNELSLKDAQAVASQYPNGNYITFVDLTEPSNDDHSTNQIGDSLSENDAQGKSERPKGASKTTKV